MDQPMDGSACWTEAGNRPGLLAADKLQALTNDLGLAFCQQDVPGAEPVQALPRNTRGRDLAVGDIHGMYEPLDRLLRGLAFDPARDRLLPLGDLVDRGPDSACAQHLLDADWCHPVRGNHDQLLLDAVAHGHPATELWRVNGGMWHQRSPRQDATERLHLMASDIAALPIAIELETDGGTVGLVHAEVPADRSWPEFVDALRAGNRVDATAAMWNVTVGQRAAGDPPDAPGIQVRHGPVPGIERLVHGHFRTRGPHLIDNQLLLDTGAELRQAGFGTLTVAQLHPGPLRCWSIDSHRTHSEPRAVTPTVVGTAETNGWGGTV